MHQSEDPGNKKYTKHFSVVERNNKNENLNYFP
jgi:hypothetical protein